MLLHCLAKTILAFLELYSCLAAYVFSFIILSCVTFQYINTNLAYKLSTIYFSYAIFLWLPRKSAYKSTNKLSSYALHLISILLLTYSINKTFDS